MDPIMPDAVDGITIPTEGVSSSAEDNALPPAATSLPLAQVSIIYFAYFAEHVAIYSLNSYLYFLVKFVNVADDPDDIGYYAGILLAVFLGTQSIMGPIWGWISDHVGRRKPFVLSGALGTGIGCLLFGSGRNFATVLSAQIFLGVLNNLSEIMPTILGELSDASNRTSVFAYLPIFNWLGAVIGPLIGGYLSNVEAGITDLNQFPFLMPNLVNVALLAIEFIVVLVFLKESHKSTVPLTGEPNSEQQPQSQEGETLVHHALLSESEEAEPLLPQEPQEQRNSKSFDSFGFITTDIILIIITSALAHFGSSAYNKLLIDFLSSPPPAGRNLSPKETGYVWSGTALVGMIFQGFAFIKISKKLGYARLYTLTLLLLVVSWVYTPFIGIGGSNLWIALAIGLTLRKIPDIVNFTCYLLLIREAAPSEDVLGKLNGLSAGVIMFFQAFGPFLAGILWSESLKSDGPKFWPFGIFLSWNIFACIGCVVFVLSLWIVRRN